MAPSPKSTMRGTKLQTTSPRREGPMDSRREVPPASFGAEAQDMKAPWVDRAIPTHHVQDGRIVPVNGEPVSSLADHRTRPMWVKLIAKRRRAKIAMGIGRIHPKLPDWVAVLLGDAEARAALHPKPILLLSLKLRSIRHRAGDTDVFSDQSVGRQTT